MSVPVSVSVSVPWNSSFYVLVAVVDVVVGVWMRDSPVLVAVNQFHEETRLLGAMNESMLEKILRRRTLNHTTPHIASRHVTSSAIHIGLWAGS